MGLDVCKRKIILELTHINVRYLVAETGVLQEHHLLSLWRMDYPLRDGASSDAEAILFNLGNGEKVCNPPLVNSHFKHSEVTLSRGRHDAHVTVPVENLPCGPDICQVPFAKHNVIRGWAVQLQLVAV